jgi:putative membrane protein
MASLRVIALQLAALPLAVGMFGVIWGLSMIAVPILRWTIGKGAERIGISVGVATQACFVAALLFHGLPPWRAGAVVAAIPVLGWLFELLGSRTGFPFGPYEYTDVLKPQISHVPVIVPLAWLMMIPPSAAVGQILAPGGSTIGRILISAAAFTAWDLFLDPQMVMWKFWRWRRKGVYFGIPLLNFLGWFLCGLAALVVLNLLLPTSACFLPIWPLFAVYVLTWFFETTAQLAFWRLYGPGLTGFVGMGVFIALVLAG